MFKRIPSLVCVSALTLLVVAAQVQAFTFSFPFPGSSDRDNRQPPGPGPWQFRPQGPGNARGFPPAYQQPPAAASGQMPAYQQPSYQQQPAYQQPGPKYGPGWPGQYPSPYGQQAPQQAGNPPRLELELSDHQPYVEEHVLLELRVVSDENLETATPELPTSNDVLFQKIEGPKASSRRGPRGNQEIVNEFVYTLTPLRAGNIEVPPLRVTGNSYGSGYGYGYGQGRGQRFEVTTSEPIRLQVRPAMASVRPWLPLENLTLKATLDGGEEVEQGHPVTLTLELDAEGATGSQLPSLESLLQSPEFRVYREQTLTENHLSQDGNHLQGRRTEYFTLVPRAGGKLQLPEIRIPWWNVTTGTLEYAGLPVHTLDVDGDSSASPSGAASGGEKLGWFWLPLAAVSLLLLGYWGGIWYEGRATTGASDEAGAERGAGGKLRERFGTGLGSLATSLSAGAAELAKRMNPAPLLARIQPRLSKALPPSSRFLRCVRTANREEDPAVWAERFQDLTCRHLQFDTQTPLPGITGKILALRPGADPEQLRSLMQQLDGALYGNQDIDFRRWKRQFRSQIGRRRGLAGSSGKKLRLIRARLPELNPQGG